MDNQFGRFVLNYYFYERSCNDYDIYIVISDISDIYAINALHWKFEKKCDESSNVTWVDTIQ